MNLPTGNLVTTLKYYKTCCMDEQISSWYHKSLIDLAEKEHQFGTSRHFPNQERTTRFWYLPSSSNLLESTPNDSGSQYVLICYAFEEKLSQILQELLSHVVPNCLLFNKIFCSQNSEYFSAEEYLLFLESQKNGYLDFDTMLLAYVMLCLKKTKDTSFLEKIRETKHELLKKEKKELMENETRQYFSFFKAVATTVAQILSRRKERFASLFEELENMLIEGGEQLKVLFANLVEKAQKRQKPIWMESKNIVQTSSLLDSKEFYELLKTGYYISYENRLYLGGPCNAGKTSFACILTGDEIPDKWISTNGLQIYFGQNGIHLKDKKMIPILKGMLCHTVHGKVISAINETHNKDATSNPNVSKVEKKETVATDHNVQKSISKRKLEDDCEEEEKLPLQKVSDKRFDNDERQKLDHTTKFTESKSGSKHKLDNIPTIKDNELEELDKSAAKKEEEKDTQIKIVEKDNPSSLFPKAQISKSSGSSKTLNVLQEETLRKSILDEIRNGEYNLEIAPSDLVDFGGQKAFDMTHQLFILQEGTFLLLFDGSKDLNEPLPEYPGQNIASADILLHWVDSVSTYCTEESGMHRIQFVATHSDRHQDNFEIRRKELVTQLAATFQNHEKKLDLCFDNLFFIDARNKDDNEIDKLKDKLVQVAFSQKSWGKKMPLLWVPLEKQIIDLKLRGTSILRLEEIQKLNRLNEDLMMDDERLNFFLRTQHAIGKLVFYDEGELAEFVIIEPSVLVNALRSFVTDEMFFPTKDQECYHILKHLQMNGVLKKNDLMKLWKQDEFQAIFQNREYKEYILRILLHLDVLVEPNVFDQNVNFSPEYYIVPCMIQTRCDFDFTEKYLNRDISICIAYVLKVQIVPPCVFFRLIASALGIWPLKEYKGRNMIFNDIATFVFDDKNDFSIIRQGRRIVVYFTHSYSIRNILPSKVASVQESLTKAMKSITEFYQLHSRSIDSLDIDVSKYQNFELEYGAACITNKLITPCFFKRGDEHWLSKAGFWKCKHGQFHEADYLSYWDSKKNHGNTQGSFTKLDFSPTVLMAKPPKDLLRKVLFAVGIDGANLGSNLGIGSSVIEKFVISNRYNIFEKTKKILDNWEMLDVSFTVKHLVRALNTIGGRGLEAVVEYYSNKPIKRGRSKSVTMLLSTQDGNTEEKGINVLCRLDFLCDGVFVDCIVDKRKDMREKAEKDDYIKRLIEFDGLYNRHLLLQERIDKKYFHFNKITEELENAILHKDLLLFRHILAYWNVFNNDDMQRLKEILTISIKNQCTSCTSAIAWKITRSFLKEMSLTVCNDVWPGFRCNCKNDYVQQWIDPVIFCSSDVVIIVEVNEIETNWIQENSFHGIPVRYEKQISQSQEGKLITEKITRWQSEDPDFVSREKGMEGSDAKRYFAQHRKLSVISPSPIKSRGYPLKQDFIKGPCIQLYCRLKGYIPVGEAHFPSAIDGIPTDILQGYAELLMEDIRIGSQIGKWGGRSGTLGGFVQYHGKDAFLTCAHVILDKEYLRGDLRHKIHEDTITVYYINQGFAPGTIPQPCGELINFAFTPDYTGCEGVTVDAAIIQLDNSRVKINQQNLVWDQNTQKSFTDTGMTSKYINKCYVDYLDIGLESAMEARSCGVVSGIQEGSDTLVREKRNAPNFKTLLQSVEEMVTQNPKPDDISELHHLKIELSKVEPEPFYFYNQISFRNVAFQPGDSGTCIYAKGRNGKSGCIGMAIASHPSGGCIVTPIKAILSAFGML